MLATRFNPSNKYAKLTAFNIKTKNVKFKIITFPVIYVFILLIASASLQSCKKSGTCSLSPARNISGTCTNPLAVTIYMASEVCGTYKRYNSTPVKMTWEITYVDDNKVDIWISSNHIGATTQLASNCGSPASLNFPISLHGAVSSSNLKLMESKTQYNSSGATLGLALVGVGNFNFTTNNLTGTITEKDCPIYCSGYETDANKCILTM